MANLLGTGTERETEGPGAVLLRVFESLDHASIPYRVIGGSGGTAFDPYEVDCVMPADVLPRPLAALLRAERDHIGADVVAWTREGHVLLASDGPGGATHIVDLHIRTDYSRVGRFFYAAAEILESRGWSRPDSEMACVPSTAIEFGCYLVEKVAKRCLGEPEGQRLSDVYRRDPAGCDRQVARFWGARSTSRIVAVAASGRWDDIQGDIPRLRAELRRRSALRYPAWTARYFLTKVRRKVWRSWTPRSGLHVVLLGPDGVGKTTMQEAVVRDLGPLFSEVQCPTVAGLLPYRPTIGRPHGQPPRSLPASVAKAGYWLLYYSLGYYLTVYPALARSTLVVNHRHLVDALVDPKRYRYAAPSWLLHMIWRVIPKPDLIILLEAPTEVVLARKQELSPEETERQQHAYRALVAPMANGHIVDAAQPADKVAADVKRIILRYLSDRTARKLGVD